MRSRQRREEVLVDVDDVALGHETRQRWNPESEWIWSAVTVHEPLISPVLDKADGADRAALYSALGLRLRYEPDR